MSLVSSKFDTIGIGPCEVDEEIVDHVFEEPIVIVGHLLRFFRGEPKQGNTIKIIWFFSH